MPAEPGPPGGSELPLASVVVVNYNGRELLGPCLDALLAVDYPRDRLEVLVVDNASADDSAAFVAAAYPRVVVLALPRNTGYAGGCNAGIRAARGEFVVALNNDTRVEPGWLRELLAPALADGLVGITGSKVVFDEEPPRINSAGMTVDRHGGVADRGYRELDAGQYDATEEVFAVCGASMLLRGGMLRDIGPFDERFFLYFEDVELCWRARLAGWRVVYAPRSVVRHHHAATTGAWSAGFRYYVARNRLLMLLKLGSNRQVLRAVAALGWESALAWLPAALRRRAPGEPPEPAPARIRRLLRVWLDLARLLPAYLNERLRWRRRSSGRDLPRWWR